jgi:nucleotide-binding universal stress UspA family protein
MSDFSVVLVPTDLTERTREAFATACSLARAGGRVVVAHAFEGHHEPSEEELRAIKGRLSEYQVNDPAVHVDYVVAAGRPAEEILRIADKSRCGLIVIGTHARVGVDRLMMGSVADEVLHRAPCPVLCLKTPSPGASVPSITSLGSFLEID